MDGWNTRFLLGRPTFRCYVCWFQVGYLVPPALDVHFGGAALPQKVSQNFATLKTTTTPKLGGGFTYFYMFTLFLGR